MTAAVFRAARLVASRGGSVDQRESGAWRLRWTSPSGEARTVEQPAGPAKLTREVREFVRWVESHAPARGSRDFRARPRFGDGAVA